MLIISVTEQTGKFHYVYWDMTTGLLINTPFYLVLWHMNHGLTLTHLSFTLSRLVSRNLGRWVWASTLRVYEASLVAQTVEHLPATWETQVQSLGWEDPLEKEMATHFSTLAWNIPWTEKPGRLQSMGSQRVGHDWATSLHLGYTRFSQKIGRVPWLRGDSALGPPV